MERSLAAQSFGLLPAIHLTQLVDRLRPQLSIGAEADARYNTIYWSLSDDISSEGDAQAECSEWSLKARSAVVVLRCMGRW